MKHGVMYKLLMGYSWESFVRLKTLDIPLPSSSFDGPTETIHHDDK